jgi:hypothetical protein
MTMMMMMTAAAVTLYTRIPQFSVRMTVETPAILIKISSGVPHSCQKIAGIVPQLGHDHFLGNHFQFTLSLPFDANSQAISPGRQTDD